MWPNLQETVDLVTFTKESLIENIIFYAVSFKVPPCYSLVLNYCFSSVIQGTRIMLLTDNTRYTNVHIFLMEINFWRLLWSILLKFVLFACIMLERLFSPFLHNVISITMKCMQWIMTNLPYLRAVVQWCSMKQMFSKIS